MPLTVNVGLNRKASRDYQSAGVSISLSVELCSWLINDPARLQAEVAKVYAEAQAALENQVQSMTVTGTSVRRSEPGAMSRNGAGQGLGNSDHHGFPGTGQGPVTVTEDAAVSEGDQTVQAENRHRQQSNMGRSAPPTPVSSSTRNGSYGGPVRPATESQLKALRSLCRRMNLRLDHEVHAEFGLESVDELDVKFASQLIDILKERQGQANPQRRWS
jgi:hypothetical protein